MEQCYTISVDDIKRMYPNFQVVSVGSVDDQTQGTQQVILAQDDSLVLNEATLQQLVTYQHPSQNTQTSTHYIIQREDDTSQSPAQQQIYYSTEVPSEQLMQSPQVQQQQQQQQISLPQTHDNTQQSLLLQKNLSPPQQQQTSLIQQSMANQNPTQHVLMQQTSHIVLQQQAPQQQQQPTSGIMIRPLSTATVTQPRYVYQHPTRTYVYNTQPQTTIQTSQPQPPAPQQQQQHQVSAPLNRSIISQQQQPTRQLVVSGTPPMQQQGLVYQSPQTQMQPQQHQTVLQQKRTPDITAPTVTRYIRTPAATRPPMLNQTPKLTPFRGNLMRYQSPHTVGTTMTQTGAPSSGMSTPTDKLTPPLTIVRPARRPAQSRSRANTTPRSRVGAANVRHPNPQAVQQQDSISTPQQSPQQQVPVRQIIPPLTATPQRTYMANITTPRTVITSQVQQRAAASPTLRMPNPGTLSSVQVTSQPTPRYRTPPTAKASLDVEDSIQAVVVSKASESTTVSKPFQTTVTTYSTVEDESRGMKVVNGRALTLSEFKRQQQQRQQQPQQVLNKIPPTSLNRTNATTVNRLVQNSVLPPPAQGTAKAVQSQTPSTASNDEKRIVRPQPQHIIQPVSNNKLQNSNNEQKSARMLVILSSGEQRLITFTLPRESCTVQELLEQVGVPFTPKTSIQCVPNPGANIDYVVTVGITVQESPSELINAVENTLQLTKQDNSPSASDQSTLDAANANDKQSIEAPPKEIPAKLIPGFLAVCQICGYTGSDFAKCERCKRVFTEEPKRISAAKVAAKPDDDKKRMMATTNTTSVTGTTTSATVQSDFLNRAIGKAGFAVATNASGLSALRVSKVTTSGRGRGRGTPRAKPAEEPVILTLSSDEEGDNEKSSKVMKTPLAIPSPPVHKPPMSCEPIITDSMVSPLNTEREDVANVSNSTDQLYTTVTCRLIRFGTYRYDPKEKVFFSSKGVKIVAPSCKNPTDMVVLNIQMREIVKILIHFSKSLNILFMYTIPSCGVYIRENLEMKSKTAETPYYNPTDRSEPYKRIVLQIESISEEAKNVIKSIFMKTILEEIHSSDANELLVRSCLKDKFIKQDQSGLIKLEGENIRQILIYPAGKGGMPINTEDYMCLAIDQYLNDVIIDFYLKYLHLNILNNEERHRTHIFSSFFYNRLTTMTTRQRQTEKDVKMTASQKRHARVKSWTKNVNLFDKDFIIIPINEQSHWFLAVICFPRLQGPVTFDTYEPVINQPPVKKKKTSAERKVTLQIGNTTITPLKGNPESVCLADDSMSERDEAEGDESDLASDESDSEAQAQNGNNSMAAATVEANRYRPIKQPLILIFDSLAGASRSRVVATLRDYLTCEYRTKIKEDSAHVFNKLNMPGHCVKVPQQNNFTDCGLYVLQYVEQFFKDPITDYKLPIKQLVNWFETIVVTRKREEISNLLKDLVEKHNPEQMPLPEIAFPTLNGKLIETELTDEQAEFEEEELDEEAEEEDEEEMDSLVGGDTEGELSPEKRNGAKAKKISLLTSAPSTTQTITLKRPLDLEQSKNQETMMRKAAKLNETN